MTLDNQRDVMKTHIDKAIEALEGAKFDEAFVHMQIAKVLHEGLIAKRVQEESLSNLAQSLTN